MDSEREAVVAQLVANLEQARSLRQVPDSAGDTVVSRMHLRAWQSARLARTYAGLLRSERFGAAAAFFLSDLYGPKDFSARDADTARLVPLMARTLPVAGLQTISSALELDALSEQLDAGMVNAMHRSGVRSIDGAAYAAAYRSVGERPSRQRQITLIGDIGNALDRLTRRSLVRGALRIMREPARLAGMSAIQEFLERGFTAFRKMGSADEFLEIIVTREAQLSAALFAGELPADFVAV